MSQSIMDNQCFEFALEIMEIYGDIQEQQEYVLSKQLALGSTGLIANAKDASNSESNKNSNPKNCMTSKVTKEPKHWRRLLQAYKLLDLVNTDS